MTMIEQSEEEKTNGKQSIATHVDASHLHKPLHHSPCTMTAGMLRSLCASAMSCPSLAKKPALTK